ncbi:MAG: hypothetical protein WCK35_25305 [Chloroflexota bacterium]
MDTFKKIFRRMFAPSQKEYYVFAIKCKRCGEIISGRVDVDNDPSVDYEGSGDSYFCRKVLMGAGKNMCYQQIEVELKFDDKRKLVERSIVSGGDFVD